jgi:hypothetical protein
MLRFMIFMVFLSFLVSSSFAQYPGRSALLDSAMLSDIELDQNPVIVSDGSSTTIVVWECGDGPMTSPGEDTGRLDYRNQNIFYKRSTNFGQTWTAKQRLGPSATTDDGDDLVPCLSTDRKGTWIAAWYSKQSLNRTLHFDRNILFSRSTDNGLTWSTNAPLNADASAGGDDLTPAIATDGNGRWIACWWSKGPDGIIRTAYSDNNGATWSSPRSLTLSSQNYVNPRIAWAGNQTWVITCSGSDLNYGNNDILLLRSTDNGVTFPERKLLDNGSTWELWPDITANNRGHLVVCWTSSPTANSGPNFELKSAISEDYGQTWSTPTIMTTLANSFQVGFNGINLHTMKNGSFFWTYIAAETMNGDGDVYFTRSDDGRNWQPPQLLTKEMDGDREMDYTGYHSVSVASNASGDFLATWCTYASYLGNGKEGDIYITRLQSDANPVEVLSPNGGEVLAGGTYVDIQWLTALDVAGSAIRLELWNDKGWAGDLGYSYDPLGIHTQTVYLPLVPEGSDYRIRAISAWNAQYYDSSDESFEITGGAAHLDYPNGGEQWDCGELQTVDWKMNTLFGGTAIAAELWNQNGKVVDLGLDWQIDGEGRMKIEVPTVPTGQQYRIRIVSLWDQTIADESDQLFSIFNPLMGQNQNSVKNWQLFE